MSSEEILPLVDDQGNVIGKAPRSQCHADRTLLHPVVHLHVFNKKGELYLQKRALTKQIQPGKWDTAVGGHIAYGEEVTDFSPIAVTSYKWQSAVESEMINVFVTVTDKPLVSRNDEIDDARFWTLDEIRNSSGNGLMTPNFEAEFRNVIDCERVLNLVGINR